MGSNPKPIMAGGRGRGNKDHRDGGAALFLPTLSIRTPLGEDQATPAPAWPLVTLTDPRAAQGGRRSLLAPVCQAHAQLYGPRGAPSCRRHASHKWFPLKLRRAEKSIC